MLTARERNKLERAQQLLEELRSSRRGRVLRPTRNATRQFRAEAFLDHRYVARQRLEGGPKMTKARAEQAFERLLQERGARWDYITVVPI